MEDERLTFDLMIELVGLTNLAACSPCYLALHEDVSRAKGEGERCLNQYLSLEWGWSLKQRTLLTQAMLALAVQSIHPDIRRMFVFASVEATSPGRLNFS